MIAIDPLLRTIQNDNQIIGFKYSNINTKSLAYADDVALICTSRNDAIRCLEHTSKYEKASNAKLNTSKSNILSFGNSNKIDNINNVHQLKEDENIRHLGFFFNSDGIINNIDDILNKITKIFQFSIENFQYLQQK